MDVTGGMGRLEGKHALVTGGTTGVGFAIAERFLQEGAMVVVTGRNQELGRRAEAALSESGRAWFLAADAGDPDAVTRSVDVAVDHLGTLDALVNNAGIGVEAGLLRTPLADYDRVMDVNVRGYFLYACAAYPHLARRRGCMIHVASDAGIWGEQSIGLYSVSKAAVVMLGKMLALEGGPDGVRSNVLCPGDTWPGMRHLARHAAHGPAGGTRPPRARRLADPADRPGRRGPRRRRRGGLLRERRGGVHHRDDAPRRRRHDRRLSPARKEAPRQARTLALILAQGTGRLAAPARPMTRSARHLC
jgi:NAD(P)-dependent dehydrogenase (short-subunit alcohol dehydrogenase family)